MFQGTFKLIKKDVNTGEITYETDWIENNITLDHLRFRLDSNAPSTTTRIGPNIVICEWDGPTSEETGQLIQAHAIGTDVTAPLFLGNGLDTPYYEEYQQTFAPPGANRNINSIGVTSSTIATGNVIQVDAWTALGATCTQTTTETLIVFYRVQFLAKLNNRYSQLRQNGIAQFYGHNTKIDRRFPEETTHYPLANQFEWEAGASDPINHVGGGMLIAQGEQWEDPTEDVLSTFDNLYFAKRFAHSATISSAIGQIRGSIVMKGTGETSFGRAAWWNNLLPPGAGKVQNIYSHSAAATKPFFDPATIPTTTGTLAISSAAWTDPDFPFVYRIDVTGSGAVGVGTYQFKRRRQTGFQGNTWETDVFFSSVMNEENEGAVRALGDLTDNLFGHAMPFQDGGGDRGELPLVYNRRTLMFTDNSKATFCDVITGKTWQFNSTLYPAFTPTAICNYEYDELSDTIWFTCANSGIYSINDPLGTPTVTFHDITGATGTIVGPLVNQAYALDVGLSQTTHRTIWAMVQGALVKSTDNGATWVAYDSTSVGVTYTNAVVEADWPKIVSIRCHKTNVNEQMCVQYWDGTTASSTAPLKLHWWDTASDSSFPFAAAEYVRRVYLGGPIRVYTNEERRYAFRQLGISPVDERFAYIGLPSNSFPNVRNNVPTWLTYGTNSTTNPDSGLANGGRSPARDSAGSGNLTTNHLMFGTDDAGSDFIYFFNEGEQDMFACGQAGGSVKLVEISGLLSTRFTSGDLGDGCKAHLGGGLFLASRASSGSAQSFHSYIMPMGSGTQALGVPGYEDELWESYGWNGAAWVLNDPGSKTIHSSTDALIDGLTITFDDAGATQTFVATDYFTAGVVNGVQLDANTEYDWEGSMYFQPHVDTILLENTVVPAAGLSAVKAWTYNSFGDYVDVAGLDAIFSGGVGNSYDELNKTGTSGTAGARLNQIAENGDFRLRVDMFTNTSVGLSSGTAFGVSASTVIGNALDINTIQYGFHITGTASLLNIDIRESGVNVANVETGLPINAFLQGLDMVIERVGTTINYYWMGKLVHSTAGILATSYVPEFVIGSGADARVIVREWEHFWTDRFTYIGTSGGSTGAFDPQLRIVDVASPTFSFTINGVEGTNIGIGDRTTALSAGEYSIFPDSGLIRLSAADAGLALAGNFTYLQKA